MNYTISLSRYITNTLGGVPLYGYNKVGDNTKPNVIPLLTGLYHDQIDHLLLQYVNGGVFHDNLPFIWYVKIITLSEVTNSVTTVIIRKIGPEFFNRRIATIDLC